MSSHERTDKTALSSEKKQKYKKSKPDSLGKSMAIVFGLGGATYAIFTGTQSIIHSINAHDISFNTVKYQLGRAAFITIAAGFVGFCIGTIISSILKPIAAYVDKKMENNSEETTLFTKN